MPKGFEDVQSGEALKQVYAERSRADDEKTVSSSNAETLLARVTAEQMDGWRVVRRNLRSCRLAKPKAADRQLEDEVWSLLYRMGFSELNASRDFTIDVDGRSPARQVDVFAKDSAAAFVVECTHSQESGPKSVKTLIDKISAIREGAIKSIHTHYGRDPKLKVKFAIATKNVEWRKADRDRAQASGIVIITEEDIAYFEKLTDLLKSAARYQFLGRYFQGEKVEGLRTSVPATRGKAGGSTFYTFLISPYELLRLAYISHRSKTSNNDLETYQRMVKPARLAAIGQFIDQGGRFPTNIVINLKTESSLNFDRHESFDDDTAVGILHLPGQYGSAWVIDGQHRLYGYAYSERERDRSVVSVLAYENLSVRDEIGMFIDINTKQVKVSRNLVNEVVSSMNIDDEDAFKRLDAMHARVALELDRYPTSPLRDRVLTVSQDKSSTRCITLTSLVDGLSASGLLGTGHRLKRNEPAAFIAGPLADLSGKPIRIVEKATKTLTLYFSLFATGGLEEHWRTGDGKGGYLCTNLGIRSLLDLFKKLIVWFEAKDQMRANLYDSDELIDKVTPLLKPLIDFFTRADANDIALFRGRGSSLKAVSDNTRQMEMIIHDSVSSYAPKELIEFMSTRDAEGTKQAKNMIDEINKIIYDDVMSTLQQHFGVEHDAWWAFGIPNAVRQNCDKLYNDANCTRKRWNYLYLSNYPEIILYKDNWNLFKDRYNFYGKGKKADLIRWIGKINIARTVTHHAEKGPLSKTEVDYVRRVYDLVKRFIEGDEQMVANFNYLKEDDEDGLSAVA